MTYIIINSARLRNRLKEKEQQCKLETTKLTETLKATEADKDKLETELKNEIGSFKTAVAAANFLKQKNKKEAERLAGELTTTQTSLKDANDKATNEKTELIKELKAINAKLKNPLTPVDENAQKQIDAIKVLLPH
jgi:protein subunit release factor A